MIPYVLKFTPEAENHQKKNHKHWRNTRTGKHSDWVNCLDGMVGCLLFCLRNVWSGRVKEKWYIKFLICQDSYLSEGHWWTSQISHNLIRREFSEEKKKMLEFWSKAQKGHLYSENLLKSLEKYVRYIKHHWGGKKWIVRWLQLPLKVGLYFFNGWKMRRTVKY